MFFATPAYAQSAPPAAGGGSGLEMLMSLAPFIAILAIMYFMIIRPQQQRQKEQAAMISAIRRGDTVVTTGGVIGKVTKATDDAELEVEIAPNVRIRVLRAMIAEVRSKGEPVKDATA
ncbi:MAG: preprotein translocase subunit YajC [Hyphomicrobiales bacterium]|nr:preprotein translocase subunit YajC [Hyphomicrobiales bacterium]